MQLAVYKAGCSLDLLTVSDVHEQGRKKRATLCLYPVPIFWLPYTAKAVC